MDPKLALVPDTAAKGTGCRVVEDRAAAHRDCGVVADIDPAAAGNAIVVTYDRIVELERRVPNVEAAAALVLAAAADREVVDRDVRAVDHEDPMRARAIDDGGIGARSLNRDVLGDLELPAAGI